MIEKCLCDIFRISVILVQRLYRLQLCTSYQVQLSPPPSPVIITPFRKSASNVYASFWVVPVIMLCESMAILSTRFHHVFLSKQTETGAELKGVGETSIPRWNFSMHLCRHLWFSCAIIFYIFSRLFIYACKKQTNQKKKEEEKHKGHYSDQRINVIAHLEKWNQIELHVNNVCVQSKPTCFPLCSSCPLHYALEILFCIVKAINVIFLTCFFHNARMLICITSFTAVRGRTLERYYTPNVGSVSRRSLKLPIKNLLAILTRPSCYTPHEDTAVH